MEKPKICSNCKNQPICKINEGLWSFYRSSIQGRVYTPVDCLTEMIEVLSKHCKHWRKID